jgi:pantoate--beta-alanine ligase
VKQILTAQDLRDWRSEQRDHGLKVAFVPTMGNLHEGHLSLVKAAQQQADRVIVSLFVNPTQFGVGEDFDTYPRTLDEDLDKLQEAKVDAVFTPAVGEVYPVYPPRVTVTAGAISGILCGRARPGHFDGVVTVVSKLFNLVEPDVACFGEKDYQQLSVIREMVADLNFNLKIHGVPTERAAYKLALSSRNSRLTPKERELAPELYKALTSVREQCLQGRMTIDQITRRASENLNQLGFTVDYLEVLSHDLTPVTPSSRKLIVLIAAKLGSVRLIDNLQFDR